MSSARRLSLLYACAAIAVCGGLTLSCARPKDRDTRTATAPSAAPGSLQGLEDAYRLYGSSDGLGQPEMRNLLTRYLGSEVDSALLGMLFDEGAENTQKLTISEIKKRVPTLNWASTGKPVSTDTLSTRLLEIFPGSTAIARDGVGTLIGRFDENWAAGNADGLLDSKELLAAGVVLGLAARENPSHDIPARLAAQPRARRILDRKLEQQVATRYPLAGARALAPDDRKLEWAQALLRGLLVERGLKGLPGEAMSESELRPFMARWGLDPAEKKLPWTSVARWYDRKPFFGGNGDGKLDATEARNLLTDALFAQTLAKGRRNGIDPAQVTALFPMTGESALTKAFGEPEAGIPEVIQAVDAASACELAFGEFDIDQDGLLDPSELAATAAALGIAVPAMQRLSPLECYSLAHAGIGSL
jgi:hypothetical protein